MSEEHLSGERELRRMIREIHVAVIPMLANTHLDVHGIRRDFRDAIERSQTAIMNRLSLIEAKVDRLTPAPGGDTVNTAALESATKAAGAAVTDAEKALDEGKPTT